MKTLAQDREFDYTFFAFEKIRQGCRIFNVNSLRSLEILEEADLITITTLTSAFRPPLYEVTLTDTKGAAMSAGAVDGLMDACFTKTYDGAECNPRQTLFKKDYIAAYTDSFFSTLLGELEEDIVEEEIWWED